jgi:hypothetical protein
MNSNKFYIELNRYLNKDRRSVISKSILRKEMDRILEKLESENMKNEFIEVDQHKNTPIFWSDSYNKYFALNKYFTTKEKAIAYIEENYK